MEKLLLLAMLAFLTLSPSLVIAAIAPAADVQASLASGENYRDQGNYALAAKKFAAVLAHAEQTGDKLTQAMATAALGYNYYLARDNAKAQPLLEKSSVLAKPLNSPALAALIDDYLGMLYLSLQQPEKAALSFTNALENAKIAQNNELIVGIRVNQAELESNTANRLRLLEKVSNEVLKLNNAPIKIKLLLAIGEQLLTMATDDTANVLQQKLLKDTYHVLNNAYQLADTNTQVRLRSQAEGYLGRLYAIQHLNQDALLWFDKAIFDAQQVNATDLLMQWEIQSGQLLHATGDMTAALQAYQRAVKHLADIRYSLPVTFHNGHSSIKGIIDPIYRGLADILLLQASNAPSSEEKQRLLGQAIDAMETIKQNELEDFFNDRCLIDGEESINLKSAILPGIGIIYPIILPDRVELLFRAGDSSQFEQKSVAVSSSEVINTAVEIAQYLRDGIGNYRPDSRKLYSWLLKAYDDTLKAKGIETVVYVPDGSLRQVPYAALLNGKKFTIEDYAIVTLPGLTLKKNLATEHKKPHALIAALSKPDGASVDELLQSSVKGVFGERGIVDMGGLSPTTDKIRTRSLLVEKLSLPSVSNEVSDLQKNMDNTTLLNQSFTYGEFNESVGTGDYSIIHVASHGYFGKSADDSFVMTYDRNLKLRDFQTILNNKNIKKNPISLLTLSACQTAEGDDRALLGFSGIAIKTNAMSAIGTLWSVNDAATALFMKNFYANFGKLPKAQALRQAQLALLKSKDLRHPYYWSPFVLVGNW
jgi:CHAT domain-containing protein